MNSQHFIRHLKKIFIVFFSKLVRRFKNASVMCYSQINVCCWLILPINSFIFTSSREWRSPLSIDRSAALGCLCLLSKYPDPPVIVVLICVYLWLRYWCGRGFGKPRGEAMKSRWKWKRTNNIKRRRRNGYKVWNETRNEEWGYWMQGVRGNSTKSEKQLTDFI